MPSPASLIARLRRPSAAVLAIVVAAVVAAPPHAAAAAAAAAASPDGEPEGVFFIFNGLGGWDFDFDFYPTRSALGDLDADGAPELLVSGRNSEGVFAIFPGVAGSGGPFGGPPQLVEVGVQTNAVITHDLDGDAVLDVILAVRSTPGRLIVLDGAGDGDFSSRRDLPVLREVADVVVHDVDDDGDPDLVCSGYGTSDLVVFRNDGAGGFGPAERHPLGLALRVIPQPFWIERGDLDGDDAADLVVSHFGSGHLSILPGEPASAGGLGPARRIPLGTPTGISLGDVDGDGDLDVFTPTWSFPDGMLTVLDNDGGGAFTRRDFPIIGFYLWGMVSPDLDGDGLPEPVITEALSGMVSILPNQSAPGTIAFDTFQSFSGGSFPWHLLTADLDDDCDIDMVLCDIGSHRVNWLLNLTDQEGCAVTDLDGNGRTDLADAMVVLAAWGRGGGIADLDHDGTVGPLDLLRVAATWEIDP